VETRGIILPCTMRAGVKQYGHSYIASLSQIQWLGNGTISNHRADMVISIMSHSFTTAQIELVLPACLVRSMLGRLSRVDTPTRPITDGCSSSFTMQCLPQVDDRDEEPGSARLDLQKMVEDCGVVFMQLIYASSGTRTQYTT
jgi:hypothetical protein